MVEREMYQNVQKWNAVEWCCSFIYLRFGNWLQAFYQMGSAVSVSSAKRLQITTLVQRKWWIKARPTYNGLCNEFVCDFSSMNTIPADIVMRISTCWSSSSLSIYCFSISTKHFLVDIVSSSSISAACSWTVLEPYSWGITIRLHDLENIQ